MENLTLACVLFVFMAVGFGVLGRLYFKLRESHSSLREDFTRQTHDLKGLLSAANNVAECLIEAERTIAELAKRIDDLDEFDNQQADGHPYNAAIKLVKNGASVEDLVEQCNVSQDEAELLIRLHGLR